MSRWRERLFLPKHFLISQKMVSIQYQNQPVMDYKKSLINLAICLLLSPVVVYVVLFAAQAAGSTYEMSHGETFIIWLLMAIVINLSLARKE